MSRVCSKCKKNILPTESMWKDAEGKARCNSCVFIKEKA